jgi:hypothetical protein
MFGLKLKRKTKTKKSDTAAIILAAVNIVEI